MTEETAAASQPRQIVIRLATQADAVKIFRLHLDSHNEAKETHDLDYPAVDENKTMQTIVRIIATGSAMVADVGDGRIVGSIGLEPAQMPWSSEWHMQNAWLDVVPAFRKHGTSNHIVQFARQFAAKRGFKFFLMFNSAMFPEIKDRWAQQQGFAYLGGTLLSLPLMD